MGETKTPLWEEFSEAMDPPVSQEGAEVLSPQCIRWESGAVDPSFGYSHAVEGIV